MKNSFAVVCEWPGVNAAENETIFRIQNSAYSLGKTLIIIDKYGNVLDKDFKKINKQIASQDVDFIVNLHFASPKCYDGFSYVALWNPIKFYHDWDYKRCSFNLVTHHDFISCLSEPADDHAVRISHINKTNNLEPKMVINHTNSGPYHKFNDNQDSIFYCGINWDKSIGKSRFAEIFEILDKENILKIYGPQKLSDGTIPWKGFKSYVDEIPFDGVSVFKEVSKCLLGLALSHEAHIESAIASSRVFELIAGGALPICDENPFFKKYFNDNVLYVSGNYKEKADQIINHYRWALENKDQVRQMVESLQNFMKENFDLTKQLEKLYEDHWERRKEVENKYCALQNRFKVNLIYIHLAGIGNDDFPKLIHSIKNQNYSNIALHIISNDKNLTSIKVLDDSSISYQIYFNGDIKHHNQTGLALHDIKKQFTNQENQLFIVTNKYEQFFYDHISSLVRCFEDNDNCNIAVSNAVLFSKEIGYGPFVNNNNSLGIIDHDFVIGCVMFKSFVPHFILKYLNPRNYKNSLKSFFQDSVVNTNKTTLNFDINNSLCKNEDYLNKSLFIDYSSKLEQVSSGDFVVSKDFSYQVLSQIKLFSPIIAVRNLLLKRKLKRKQRKKQKESHASVAQ